MSRSPASLGHVAAESLRRGPRNPPPSNPPALPCPACLQRRRLAGCFPPGGGQGAAGAPHAAAGAGGQQRGVHRCGFIREFLPVLGLDGWVAWRVLL